MSISEVTVNGPYGSDCTVCNALWESDLRDKDKMRDKQKGRVLLLHTAQIDGRVGDERRADKS